MYLRKSKEAIRLAGSEYAKVFKELQCLNARFQGVISSRIAHAV